MTATPDHTPLDGCDDPASVLRVAREQKRVAAAADRQVAQAAAAWLAMHSGDGLVGPSESWQEQSMPLGGEGCPEVAEFAIAEFGAAIGMSPEAGRRMLTKYAEGYYRLTRCWKRLVDGQLEAWRLGMIAERTLPLSPAAAGFVDAHVAPVAHKIGPAQLIRLVEEAAARFDPEATEAARAAATDARRFDIDLAGAGIDGTVRVEGDLDHADALDLAAAVSAGASELAALGSTESLDVRRAKALGQMARTQLCLEFTAPEGTPAPRVKRRQVVLHAHLSADAIAGTGGVVRLRETATPLTAEQVREWCHTAGSVVVTPILDLAEHIHVGSYEASDRLRAQTEIRDGTCIFPWCTRSAHRCDLEHRVPHGSDGPTCSCNQAPMCRTHHRHKTTGRWTYVTVEPGTYLWHSPHGYQFLRDHTGTLDVTPDDDRRRKAHQLIAHLDEP
jgi:hypothetical protein